MTVIVIMSMIMMMIKMMETPKTVRELNLFEIPSFWRLTEILNSSISISIISSSSSYR